VLLGLFETCDKTGGWHDAEKVSYIACKHISVAEGIIAVECEEQAAEDSCEDAWEFDPPEILESEQHREQLDEHSLRGLPGRSQSAIRLLHTKHKTVLAQKKK